MNENIRNNRLTTDDHAHVVFINRGKTRARLGWVSPSTLSRSRLSTLLLRWVFIVGLQ
jgi:hypothetical protein